MIVAGSRPYAASTWWPLALAIAAWLAIAWSFGQLLLTPKIQIESPPPIEARIVELPDSAPPPAPTVPTPPKPHIEPKVVHLKKPVPPKSPAPQPKPIDKPVEMTPPKVETPVTKTVRKQPSPAPAPNTTHQPPANAEQGARAIYRPMPKIPDELREEALSAVAVVRFHIMEDGTATVEFVTPTPDPRINQLILNTLKTWRFFPALKFGKPVRSVREIKIHLEID